MTPYASKRRCKRLIKIIVDQCVIIHSKTNSLDHELLSNLCEWCKEHVGKRRPHHPIYEAEQGWIDFFEGVWSCTTINNDYWFWFSNHTDRVLFKLTWDKHGD